MAIPPDINDFSKEEIMSALDDVRHPFEIAIFSSDNYYNFGAIVRVSHNFLAKKIWMIDFNEFYGKASMGCHSWEHISKITLSKFIKENSSRNIVVFERRDGLQTKNIFSYEYPENPIFFFGSEKFGVPDQIVDVAYDIVSIPVFGIKNDHNLAVSTGIVMYDFVKKYYKK